jgi:hypothetical protein
LFRYLFAVSGGGRMKKTIPIFGLLVISALIIALPYKEYPTLFPDVTIKITIYREIIKIFTPGIWTHVAFLFVLLPPVLFLQVGPSPLRIYKRVLFLAEGILAFLAAFLMLIIMSINPSALSHLVIIKPMFYLSLGWVLLGTITAILLMTETIYNKVGTFLCG